MTTIFFGIDRIREFIRTNSLPCEINNCSSIGICCISDIFEIIEDWKVNNILISEITTKLDRIYLLQDTGKIFLTTLSVEKVSDLLNSNEIWLEKLNKSSNPYQIVKYFELYPTVADFWDFDILDSTNL